MDDIKQKFKTHQFIKQILIHFRYKKYRGHRLKIKNLKILNKSRRHW